MKELNIFKFKMTDTCGNCKFFNEHIKMVNDSYICNFQSHTTRPENMGCYKIQFSRIDK